MLRLPRFLLHIQVPLVPATAPRLVNGVRHMAMLRSKRGRFTREGRGSCLKPLDE
jgi:hypothetical protein